MDLNPDKPLGDVLQEDMPSAPQIQTLGAAMHGMARGNNQELYFTTPDDSEILFGR